MKVGVRAAHEQKRRKKALRLKVIRVREIVSRTFFIGENGLRPFSRNWRKRLIWRPAKSVVFAGAPSPGGTAETVERPG
jgi:hypothetical protein